MNATAGTKERLLMRGDQVDCSLMPKALEWWAKQDDMGGFHAVGRVLYPGWEPGASCLARATARSGCRSSASSRTRGATGIAADHSNGTVGSLAAFADAGDGMTAAEAMRWLMHNARLQGPNEIHISKPQFQANNQPEEEIKTMQAAVSNQSTPYINGNAAPLNGSRYPRKPGTRNKKPGTSVPSVPCVLRRFTRR